MRSPFEPAFQAGERGDVAALARVLHSPVVDSSTEAQGWLFALRALRWSLAPAEEREPAPREVVALAASAPRPVTLGAMVLARAALLGFDAAAAAGWERVIREVGGEPVGWHRLLSDGGEGAPAPREGPAEASSSAGPIEAVVYRGLLHLARGETADGVQAARRAFLMAQAEGVPPLEWLAGLALARGRRRAGQPHLALHVLSALAAVAAPAWRPWLVWELLLGGGAVAPARALALTAPDSPARRAALALGQVIEAARLGDRTAFDDGAALLVARVRGVPLCEAEATALLALLDPDAAPPPLVVPWCRGEHSEVPLGLYGVGAAEADGAPVESTTAFVVAAPGRRGRRLLGPGRSFARAASIPDAGSDEGAGARVETAIATLLLAGPGGLPRDAFFEAVYGFRFVFDLHHGVLEVLVHRTRERLGDFGEITRGEDPPHIALALARPVVVRDVRCAVPTADRLLRLLVHRGPSGSEEAARALRLSARTVQRVLKELVTDGACRADRVGRHIVYRVEDTVFTSIGALSPPLAAPEG